MALQHLYSRVPARLSMFNKTDGFDTFACSEQLSREYIEKELSQIYDNMPTKNEAVLIRDGKLPPVYLQKCGKDGEIIQSCLSYIAKDYTGERSAYLVHSLVIDGDEKLAITETLDNAAINKDMLICDFSQVGIEREGAFPDSAYPEKPYTAIKAGNVSALLEKYEAKTLKFMIYAVLNLLCGKARALFPVLGASREELSGEAVDFMNLFLQIIPYHLRPMLSFVSDAGDTSKFGSFKIRFLCDNSEVPAQKGMAVIFKKKTAIGIREEEVSANLQMVDFFFSLISNEAVRREFLIYVDNVVKKNPSLAAPNPKNLQNLVFLFKRCSGLFNEMTVIPNDDKMYEFISVYEKYRSAISDEYRMNALKCIQRYPSSHTEIPKKVFSKLTHFYSSEPDAVKRLIMNVVLDLIHTDVMRDKLFSFIKSVYPDENDDCRALINKHLCSVYYGGFLQSQIFSFFAENFDDEPQKTKEMIIDKLLLTIRTPSMQQHIVAFFDEKFDMLSGVERTKFYETFFQMIPEGDALALRLVDLVNTHIESEGENTIEFVKDGICKAAENDQRRKNPKLVDMLIEKDGFCSDCLVEKVFSEWSERKIFSDYVEKICEYPPVERAKKIISVLNSFPDISDDALERFENKIVELSDASPKIDITALIEEESVFENAGDGYGERAKALISDLIELIHGKIVSSIYDIFGLKYRENGMSILAEYANSHQYVVSTDEFKAVVNYLNMVDAMNEFNAQKLLALVKNVPDAPKVRSNIGQCLKRELPDLTNPDENQATAFAVTYAVIGRLGGEKYAMNDVFSKTTSLFESKTKNAAQAEFENERGAFVATLCATDKICADSDDFSAEFIDQTGISDVLSSFLTKHEKRAPKWLASSFGSIKIGTELKKYCLDVIKEMPGGIKKNFKKLLRK